MALIKILNDPTELFLDKYLGDIKDESEKKLLEIFCYGTYQDYKAIESTLSPELRLKEDSIALKKLQQLTILSEVKGKSQVSYSSLLSITGVKNSIDLESLIIDLIALDLLVAKIDEQNQVILIERATSRCIPNLPEDLQSIFDQITQMRSKIAVALEEAI